MQYIEAPSKEKPRFKSLFLAGGIVNCPNWQVCVAEKLTALDITIFNPRRKMFPKEVDATREQIQWEYEWLRSAYPVSFWFSEGSLNPIVLFEFGAVLERNQRIVVGIHHDYERRVDVEIQTSLKSSGLKISYSLDDLIKEIKRAITTA